MQVTELRLHIRFKVLVSHVSREIGNCLAAGRCFVMSHLFGGTKSNKETLGDRLSLHLQQQNVVL